MLFSIIYNNKKTNIDTAIMYISVSLQYCIDIPYSITNRNKITANTKL